MLTCHKDYQVSLLKLSGGQSVHSYTHKKYGQNVCQILSIKKLVKMAAKDAQQSVF